MRPLCSLAWLLLLLPAAPGGDAALSREQLSRFYSKGMFIMESEHFNMCIRVDTFGILLENCSQLSVNMLWKWVSGQHIFNLGSSTCLGLNISNREHPLGMHECDSPHHSLRWDCINNEMISASKHKLAVENGTLVATQLLSHKWKRYTAHGEDFCDHPFQEVYTLLGNGLGAPCVFPFKYHNKWYHECFTPERVNGMLWCATSSHFNRDRKWGFCPIADIACNISWEKNSDMQACYQFNIFSALSWSEARASCQAQGGDLLSITNLREQKYINKRLSSTGVFVWIGLNHLDEATGWQWSDGAPLVIVNWKSDISYGPVEERHCGVFNSRLQSWQSFACQSSLPYACKKYLNLTKHETFHLWKYYPTQCDAGWFSYNKNCYKLQTEKQSWKDALSTCNMNDSDLISITSLADVELLVTLLENQNVTETWIGLTSNTTQFIFKWSDGSEVTLTDWYKHEPNMIRGADQICVSAQGLAGHWSVRKCEEQMFSICKKAGHFQTAVSVDESGCEEDWERHGGFCYKINTTPQSFEEASSGYGCAASLLTVTNRFEQAFVNSMFTNLVKTENSFFWIALQYENNTGEYIWKTKEGSLQAVTYTNWNKHQPSHSGGCIAMRYGPPVGRWEVKDCRSFKAMSVCKHPVRSNKENSTSEILPSDNAYRDMCYHGWESDSHLSNCFKVFHSEKVLTERTWDEAEQFCQDLGGRLASFSHINEAMFLDKLLSTMFLPNERRRFWIGLSKRNPMSVGSWEWSDGEPVVSSYLQNMYIDNHARNCAAFKTDNVVLPLKCDSKLEWICKIPKGVKQNFPKWHVIDPPWTFFQGAEYLFYNSPADFHVFRFACGWLGGLLLSIHSSDEQEFIVSKLRKISKSGSKWWIGILAENPGDQFRWQDNLPFVYQNWDTEKNRMVPVESTRCGYISSDTGLWGDEECDAAFPGICKATRIFKIEKAFPKDKQGQETQHGECPKGWLYFGYKCFLMKIPKDDGQAEDWFSAHKYCGEHDGLLASIDNKMEQAFITMQLFGHKTSIWIERQKEDVINSESEEPLKYSNWSPIKTTQQHGDESRPNATEEVPLCTLMSNNHNFHLTGKWYLQDCYTKGYGFVCEKAQDTSKRTIPASDMYPLPDVLEYGNRTYRIINGNMSWTEALNMCMEHGAQLVSITDQYHQAFLTVIVNRKGFSHWIGLSSLNEEPDFQWSDGTKSLFTSWRDEGSPSLGECAYIDTNGDWSTDDCETLLQGAVCHVLTEQRTPESKGKCPETEVPWIQFKSNCYSFSTALNSTRISEAYGFCKLQGSKLLTIQDEEEHTFILEELRAFHSSVIMIWLSIIYEPQNSTFMWHDGSALNYSNWGSGEPAWNLGSDHCVSMSVLAGEWQVSFCTETNGFICKTHTDVDKEETVNPIEASYHGFIPLAVIATILIIMLTSFLWCVCKKNKSHSWRMPFFRNLQSTQTVSETSNLEESILITELETHEC